MNRHPQLDSFNLCWHYIQYFVYFLRAWLVHERGKPGHDSPHTLFNLNTTSTTYRWHPIVTILCVASTYSFGLENHVRASSGRLSAGHCSPCILFDNLRCSRSNSICYLEESTIDTRRRELHVQKPMLWLARALCLCMRWWTSTGVPSSTDTNKLVGVLNRAPHCWAHAFILHVSRPDTKPSADLPKRSRRVCEIDQTCIWGMHRTRSLSLIYRRAVSRICP